MTYSTQLNLIALLIIILLLSSACTRTTQEQDAATPLSSSTTEVSTTEVANDPQSSAASAEPTQTTSDTTADAGQTDDDSTTGSPPNAVVLCTAEGRDQLWFWDSKTAQWQLSEMVQLQESAILPQALVPLAGAPDAVVMIGAGVDQAGETGLFIGQWREGEAQWAAENDAASYTPNLNQFQSDADALYAIDSDDPSQMVRLNYAACARGDCVAEPVAAVNMANPSGTHALVWDVAGGLSLLTGLTGDGVAESLATTAYGAQWLNDTQLIYLDADGDDPAGANRLMLKPVEGDAVQLADREQVQDLVDGAGSLVDARAAGNAVLVALGDAAQPTTFAVALINVESGAVTYLTDLSVAEWNSVQLAPSGRYAAIGRNNNLDLFDLTTGQVVSTYAISGSQSQGADFSADNRWLLALTANGVEIIDLETLQPADAALPDMEPLGRPCSIGVFLE